MLIFGAAWQWELLTVPALFVNSDTGYVGIGTTTPASLLSVYGGMSVGAGYEGTAAPTDGMITKGNIGIGTTSPAYGLELMGSSTLGYFGVSGSTQGDVFIINASGYVGIATATPAYNLDVWGNAAFGSTTIPLLLANSDTGRVGVNTTTPAYDVDIWGSLAVGTTTCAGFVC